MRNSVFVSKMATFFLYVQNMRLYVKISFTIKHKTLQSSGKCNLLLMMLIPPVSNFYIRNLAHYQPLHL
jgi:hypothetical protein